MTGASDNSDLDGIATRLLDPAASSMHVLAITEAWVETDNERVHRAMKYVGELLLAYGAEVAARRERRG